jgi:hypothetical protein
MIIRIKVDEIQTKAEYSFAKGFSGNAYGIIPLPVDHKVQVGDELVLHADVQTTINSAAAGR